MTDREYQAEVAELEQLRNLEPRHTHAKQVARAVLKASRILAPPVDIESVVRNRKLILKKVDVAGSLSGVLHAELREIVINTRERSPERQRFTIAHELGHFELRHFELADLPADTLGFAAAFDSEGAGPVRSAVEVEANAFAAELLMPSAWIKKIVKGLAPGEPQRLADLYRVSREAMFYQLMSHGRL